MDYSAVEVVPLRYRTARCNVEVAPKKPPDGVRCPSRTPNHPPSANLRLKSEATFPAGFQGAQVIGCGTVRRWENRSPFAAETVGQHMQNRIFLGEGEEKRAVQLEQSWGSEEGEYTV